MVLVHVDHFSGMSRKSPSRFWCGVLTLSSNRIYAIIPCHIGLEIDCVKLPARNARKVQSRTINKVELNFSTLGKTFPLDFPRGLIAACISTIYSIIGQKTIRPSALRSKTLTNSVPFAKKLHLIRKSAGVKPGTTTWRGSALEEWCKAINCIKGRSACSGGQCERKIENKLHWRGGKEVLVKAKA